MTTKSEMENELRSIRDIFIDQSDKAHMRMAESKGGYDLGYFSGKVSAFDTATIELNECMKRLGIQLTV